MLALVFIQTGVKLNISHLFLTEKWRKHTYLIKTSMDSPMLSLNFHMESGGENTADFIWRVWEDAVVELYL